MADEEKIDFSLFINEYLNDAREGFQKANSALLALEKEKERTEILDVVGRALHTLKSSSTMLGFRDIAELAHFSEDILAPMRRNELHVTQEAIDALFEVIDTLEGMVKERAEKKEISSELEVRSNELKKRLEALTETEESDKRGRRDMEREEKRAVADSLKTLQTIEKIDIVRVHIRLLDALFNQVGELLIARNRLETMLHGSEDKELKGVLSNFSRIINAMQENVSAARLVPVDEVFRKFPRMVRDLAREQSKEIDLIIEGSDIELDKSVLDAISEPLIHLLRNAVGHGIESPAEREKNGKSRRGTVRLVAMRAENHVLINVEDDGRGIDLERMKEIAVLKGFVKEEDARMMKDSEVMKLLFVSGFSSTMDVTGLSGRGIGLNVVKTAAREMGGIVEVSSEKGKGARFSMTLPLTTAILQTLMVEVSGHVFAIPSDIVLETMRIEASELKDVADRKVFVRGREVIPFSALGDTLGMTRRPANEYNTVIIHRGGRLMGLGVDEVIGQMDNIIKPFDPIARGFRGFSGGTILGDGRVALLLDIPILFGIEAVQEERFEI